MRGEIIQTAPDTHENATFAVRKGTLIIPVLADEVLLRTLAPGDELDFLTDRETGAAIPISPPKVIGCQVNNVEVE